MNNKKLRKHINAAEQAKTNSLIQKYKLSAKSQSMVNQIAAPYRMLLVSFDEMHEGHITAENFEKDARGAVTMFHDSYKSRLCAFRNFWKVMGEDSKVIKTNQTVINVYNNFKRENNGIDDCPGAWSIRSFLRKP